MSATTAGCRCTSKRKCPWTSCTPRAPSPSPSSAPSAACGKCSRYASRPGDPRARPHSHPGRVLLPSRLLRQPRFNVGAPPTVRKRSQTTTPEPAPFAPGAGTVRGPAPALVYVGAPPTVRKRSQTPTTEPAPFAPGAGTVRGPAPALVYVGAPPSVRKRSQTTTPEPAPIRTRGGCSYNKLVEVLGGVPFGHLFVQLAPGTVDLAAALYCGPYGDLLGPAHEVGIALRIEEFGGAVHLVGHYAAIPGPDGHVGDAVLVPGDIGVVGQLPIEHVQLTLGFHGVAVDRVLVLLRRVGVEVTEAAADEGRTAHLPEQPVEALGTTTDVLRNEGAEPVRQIQQDGAGLEQPQRRVHAGVEHRRDLGVGVDLDEAAAELIALADANQPGVVFRLAEAGLQQLFKHDGDLDPVGRGQRIQLQRMLATRQLTRVGGPGNGPVDAGKLAAVVLVPGPDPWWYVAVFAHDSSPSEGTAEQRPPRY